jgi:putative FmdB family regulatory protein
MPLYEYECESCGHRFEVIQKFSDPLIEACPKCGGPVRKLMSSPAIQFKGSGWYITDYAKKDSGSAAKKDAGEGKSGEKSSESTGESAKPAATDSKDGKDSKNTKESKPAKDTKAAAAAKDV